MSKFKAGEERDEGVVREEKGSGERGGGEEILEEEGMAGESQRTGKRHV